VKKLENLEGKDPRAIIDRVDRRSRLKSKVSHNNSMDVFVADCSMIPLYVSPYI
jgi:hypothetical protein